MKLYTAAFFSVGVISIATAADEPAPLVDDTAKINYSVGYQIGSDFRYQEMEIRPSVVIQGIRDALAGDEALMTSAEMRKTMSDLGKRLADEKRQKKEALLQQRLQKSRQFHADNAKKSGVTTRDSGLQYRVLESGRGNSPQGQDKVLVHYTGKLLDGSQFDSSHSRGEPASFQVDQVIKGWTEALQLMKQGDRWQLYIPPELAYGETGAGQNIPPNSTLIFDVELISIEEKAAAQP